MTLIVAATGPESLWLMGDRRLTYKGRTTKDDARKLMFLETKDGMAILGYSGLGQTALGTEPADWMSAVLRGRSLPLEHSLGVLADAIKKQIPPHLVRLSGQGALAHNVIAAAFVDGEARLYTIDLVFSSDRSNYNFRYTRHMTGRSSPAKARAPRLAIAGSGALYLMKHKTWMRDLLRVLKAYDGGRLSANAVADHFAALNSEVYAGLVDKTVGPRSVVAWRNKKDGVHRPNGGGHRSYTGTTVDASMPSLPTIGNGMDVQAVISAMMPHVNRTFEAMRTGQPPSELDKDEINAELARLPDKPDEDLR
jgi:hypothetical protein